MGSGAVPPTNSALLGQSLADSPLPPDGRPLMGFSAVVVCRANASQFILSSRSALQQARPRPPSMTPARSAPPDGGGCQTCWRLEQVSPDKNGLFPLMHPPHLPTEPLVTLDFVVCGQLVPLGQPRMRFVFLGSRIFRELPPDSASRRTPLLLANGRCVTNPRSGLSPYRNRPCRAYHKRRGRGIDLATTAF